jgi:hypothetical protein
MIRATGFADYQNMNLAFADLADWVRAESE